MIDSWSPLRVVALAWATVCALALLGYAALQLDGVWTPTLALALAAGLALAAVVGVVVPMAWHCLKTGQDWAVLAAAAAGLPVAVVAGEFFSVVVGPDVVGQLPLLTVWAAGWAFCIASVPAVWAERSTKPGGWKPSALYYLVALGGVAFFGQLAAVVYCYQRHRAVGVP